MVGGIAFAAMSAALVATLSDATEIALAGREVRVADVAIVDGPDSPSMATIVIGRVPAGARTSIPREQLAQLIRRAIPGVVIEGRLSGEVAVIASPSIAHELPSAPYSVVEPVARRGDELLLVSRSGSVTITRHVTALQTASRSQRKLFVRTDDGSVVSAQLDALDGQ